MVCEAEEPSTKVARPIKCPRKRECDRPMMPSSPCPSRASETSMTLNNQTSLEHSENQTWVAQNDEALEVHGRDIAQTGLAGSEFECI